MKKITTLTTLALLLAQTPVFAAQGSSAILEQMTEGGVETDSTYRDVTPTHSNMTKSKYEEVIYEHLKFHAEQDMENKELLYSKSHAKDFTFDVEEHQLDFKKKELVKQIALLKAQKEEADEKARIPRFVRGYCYTTNEMLVERMATYAYLECDFNEPFGKSSLAVSLVPEFYAKALVGNPLYIANGDKRYPISNGVVLTKDKNSLNLANVVNDHKLQKMLATGAYKGLGIVGQNAQAYIEDERASRTQQEIVVTDGIGGTTVTQATNTLPPDKATYWALAGIQFVSEISKVIGESYVQDLPYTFKVNQNRVFYVDVQLATDGNMEGYKVDQPNIFKKEPIFGEGKSDVTETVPVLNNHVIENTSTSQTKPTEKTKTVSENENKKTSESSMSLEELEAELEALQNSQK
ncbi:MAG: hypothetical protein IE916_00590 [Epsilonproteobacteria bacterium]|nr:hypothetical protein [Campylobacterota bacterium]